MTTQAQIKRLVKPLLERHDDLVLVGQWILLRPTRHVVRGILIDRTGQARLFLPTWAVADICEPREIFLLNWGQRFGHAEGGLWFWDDATVQDVFIDVVERNVLPLLRPIATLNDFVAFADDEERFRNAPFGAFLLSSVIVEAARGNLEIARAICERLATGRTRWSAAHFREPFDRVMHQLRPLLEAEDRSGLGNLLREWETYSVRKLKLESVWEPTSFPVEMV